MEELKKQEIQVDDKTEINPDIYIYIFFFARWKHTSEHRYMQHQSTQNSITLTRKTAVSHKIIHLP